MDMYITESKKGMYSLKQAALLVYNFLKQNLEPHGYFPIPHTTGFWKHKHRKKYFLSVLMALA